jgi:hypothetical protein
VDGDEAARYGRAHRRRPVRRDGEVTVAQQIEIPEVGSTAKIRNIIAVPVLAIVTLGVYMVFWWYFVNRELADLGRSVGSSELGDSPAKSTLALFPGALLVIPALWTAVTTFQRVQAAQRLAGGGDPINGWIGLILYIVFSPAYLAYMQSGLNATWRAVGAQPEGQAAIA